MGKLTKNQKKQVFLDIFIENTKVCYILYIVIDSGRSRVMDFIRHRKDQWEHSAKVIKEAKAKATTRERRAAAFVKTAVPMSNWSRGSASRISRLSALNGSALSAGRHLRQRNIQRPVSLRARQPRGFQRDWEPYLGRKRMTREGEMSVSTACSRGRVNRTKAEARKRLNHRF